MIFAISALIIAIAMSINTVLNTLANTHTKFFKCYELSRLDDTDTDEDEDENETENKNKEHEKKCKDAYWFDRPLCKEDDGVDYDINSPNLKRPRLSKPVNILEKYNASSIY